jgi:hypothetical protein
MQSLRPMMQQVNLGMIGGGTVGSGVFHALQLNGGLLASRIGVKINVRKVAAQTPARAWRTVSWRNGTHAPWRARFWACRVTPAHDWRTRRVAPEIWLLCQRDLDDTPETKYYFVHLPATASLKVLVRLAHHRWAIEQQYQELKDELGETLRQRGMEFGATTGRPRRCGWFDAVAVRHAVRINGSKWLALTKLDVLEGVHPLKVAVGYREHCHLGWC